jgi:phage-related protein
MKWQVAYYNSSVEESAHKLDKSIKAKYTAIVDMMCEHGPDLGLPYTRAMSKGLFEIRAKGQAGIARGFFCTISNKTIVILNVFIKKTQATPQKELLLARKRMKEVKQHDI